MAPTLQGATQQRVHATVVDFVLWLEILNLFLHLFHLILLLFLNLLLKLLYVVDIESLNLYPACSPSFFEGTAAAGCVGRNPFRGQFR